MKSALLYMGLLLLIIPLYPQQLERSVIGSTGRNVQSGSLQLSYTIGEVIVTTQRNNNQILTQGFHQADISCNAPVTAVSTRDATERCKDGTQQFINLTNNGTGTTPGVNYTYVITNAQNIIVRSFKDLRFDIDELQAGNYRIYGVYHDDPYNPQPGINIQNAVPEICKRISSNFIPLSLALPPSDAVILTPVSDTTLCGNAQISLIAESPESGNGTWRGSTGIQFTNPFSPNTIATGLQAGINNISWELTTPGCPAKSDNITIEYTPPSDPAEILTGSLLSICSPDGHQVRAKVPATDQKGKWVSSNPGVNFTPNDSAFVVNVNNLPPDRSVIYWVLGDQPCQTRDSIIVFNDAVSSIPEILNPPDTSDIHTICTNQVSLSAREPENEGEEGFWRIIGPGVLDVDPSFNATDITIKNIPENRQIEAVWEITKGNCQSEVTASRRFFNIGGVSAAEIFAGDSIVLCDGEPLELTANEPENQETGRWSATSDITFSPSRESNEVSISGLPAGSTDITWSISAPNCPDNQSSINIFVIDSQTSLFESETETLCEEDEPLTLTPQTEPLGEVISYLWSNGLTTPSIQVDPQEGESLMISLTVETAAGCDVEDEIQVSRDTLGLEIAGTPVCVNGEIVNPASLLAEISGSADDISYSWSSGQTSSSITVDEPGLYQVTITNENNCQASSFYEVLVDEYNAGILPGDTTIDLGSSISLTATGGDVYTWDPHPTLSCTNCNSPRATPEETTRYTVTITRFSGCIETASVEIGILTENATCGQVFIPNILTPGDNGFNDVWQIDNLSPQNELNVYDRWGNEVFSASPYQNNWDGDNIARGTYLYILKLGDGQICRGSLSVIPDN